MSPALWLDAWERSAALPPALQPCALLAPLLPPGQPAAETWPLGLRDAALLDLHTALFGPEMAAAVHCPACKAPLDVPLDARQLRVAPGAAAPAANSGCLQHERWRVQWRLPTSLDLAAAAGAADETQARSGLLQRCVQHAEHAGRTVETTALPEALVLQIAQALSEADPQSLIELSLQCPDCGHGWTDVFDIGAFVVARLGHWAGQTLDQVHLLASAYGWTEGETLRLSAARRGRYIERVLA